MSFAEKKGITLASGFKLQAEAHIDARFSVDTIADRDELVTLNAAPEGIIVYVIEQKRSYQYKGPDIGWDPVTTSSSSYVHPTTSGNKHIPAGGASGQILRYQSDGTAKWDDETVVPMASETQDGKMSKEMFAKVEGIEAGANNYVLPKATASVMGGVKFGGTGSNITETSSGQLLAANIKTGADYASGTVANLFLKVEA